MVSAGTLQIGGSIDTGNIESGLKRVESGFEDVSSTSDGVNADFQRIGQSAKRVSKVLMGLGVGAVTGLVGIAKNTPAVAGAMASIKVSADRLKRSVGRALQDEFNSFANTLKGLANWVDKNPNWASGIIKGITWITGALFGLGIVRWAKNLLVGFFGYIKKVGSWGVWTTLGNSLKWLGDMAKQAWGWVSKFFKGGAGAGGITRAFGVTGIAGGIALPQMIRTWTGDVDRNKLGGEEEGWLYNVGQIAEDWIESKERSDTKQITLNADYVRIL